MLSPRSIVASAATLLLLALAAPSATAQSFDAVRPLGPAGRDVGVAGAAVIAGTRYLGSDERRTRLLPLLDYQWANGWFAGATSGIGYQFASGGPVQYGLRLTADFGRKARRSAALAGMGDIDAQPEFGGFASIALGQGFALTTSLRYGSGNDAEGVLFDVGGRYGRPLSNALRLGVGVSATAANGAYMQDYFGVTPAQSATSGYAAYQAGAGLRDARTSLSLTWSFAPRTSLTTVLSATRLLGDAQDSPITRRKTSATGVVALAYLF